MIPISIKASDITWVDFKNKKILDQKVFVFNKMELLCEGLIDFNRLVRRGKVELVWSNIKPKDKPIDEIYKHG